MSHRRLSPRIAAAPATFDIAHPTDLSALLDLEQRGSALCPSNCHSTFSRCSQDASPNVTSAVMSSQLPTHPSASRSCRVSSVSPFLAELFPMPFAARSQMQFGAFLRTVEAPTPPLLDSGVARLLGRLQPGSPLRPVLGEAVWAYVLASVCSNGVAVGETRLSCATVIHMWLVYT